MFKKATTALVLMALSLMVVVTLEAFLFQPQKVALSSNTSNVLTPKQQLLAINAKHPLIEIYQSANLNPQQALEKLEHWRANLSRPPEVIEQVYSLWIRRIAAKREPDTLESIDSQLNKIAQAHRLSWLLAKLQIESAYRDIKRGTYTQGIETVTDAIEFAERIQAEFLLLEAYNTAGILYNANNQLKQSQKFFNKGIKLGAKYPESELNARFNNNLGLLYVHSEQWQRSLEYLTRAELLYANSKYAEPETLLVILMNQSFIYNQLGEVGKSREAFDKGLRYISEQTPEYYRVIRLKSEARLLLLEGKPEKAIDVAQQCIKVQSIDKYPKQKGICQLEYALALKDLGKVDKAHEAVVESIWTFVQIEHKRWLIRSHLVLADILEKRGEYKEALAVYQTYHEKEHRQILKEIHNLETAFEFEELEQERDLLDVQNKLTQLEQGLTEQRVRVLYLWLAVVLLIVVWLVLRWLAERKRSQYLHDLSFKDPLTRVGNRRLYQQELNRPVLLNSKAVYRVTLIDLDRFKSINDQYGHEFGDRVLKETASRLLSQLEEDELIVRWGGEEFLIVLKDGEHYRLRAQALINAVGSQCYEVNQQKLNVTISVGASEPYMLEGLKVSKRAFSTADECLYKAKNQGRNQLVMPEDV